MSKHALALFILFAALMATVRAQERLSVQNAAAQTAWREDLRALAKGMVRIHPKLFWRVSEAEFRAALNRLEANIPDLTDEQIKVELIRIVALIDGHTRIFPFQPAINFRLYPLRLYLFSDGLYVIQAQAPYQDSVGKRVIRVGKLDVDAAHQKLAPLASRDNDMTVKLLTPLFFVIPEALHALGIVEAVDQPGFVVADAAGNETVLNPKPISSGDYRAWSSGGFFVGLPQQAEPLHLRNRYSQNFWFEWLADSQTLYIQYNQVRSSTASGDNIVQFSRKLAEFMKTHPVERLVLDLRHNPGGDNTTYRSFLTFFSRNPLNRKGRLFTILGRQTFSAAANFATDMERLTETIFVGEPMGGSPNLYGDVRPLTLPNSGIVVQVSARYWQKSTPDDKRPSIEPAIPAPMSAADYFKGRDPALAAILDHPK